MADAGTVAVLLPCAFYILRETQLPPVDIIRDYHLPLAISTDLNPGSSPVASVLLSMNMACTFFHLTPLEALRGVTINAAIALGLGKSIGTLRNGKQADLAVWDINHPAELAYWAGLNPCVGVIKNGVVSDSFTLLR